MKYTLETYGWTMDVSCHFLTDEQVSEIKQIMTENGYEELWEARYDIEDRLGIYIHEPNMFQISKGLHNGTMYFYVKDEDGNIVTEFGIEDTTDVYDAVPNIDEYKYEGYDSFPSKDKNKNILLVIDESKGGINDYHFESDEIPAAADFSYQPGSVETPDGDWDFISRIFFKTTELEVYDHLDNTGKASTIELWTLENSGVLDNEE